MDVEQKPVIEDANANNCDNLEKINNEDDFIESEQYFIQTNSNGERCDSLGEYVGKTKVDYISKGTKKAFKNVRSKTMYNFSKKKIELSDIVSGKIYKNSTIMGGKRRVKNTHKRRKSKRNSLHKKRKNSRRIK
jgi:hypothetical protein